MKLCSKKVYCPQCQRLVKGREQLTNADVSIVCPRCGLAIWIRDNFNWRYAVRLK